jgi:hypothetical protein
MTIPVGKESRNSYTAAVSVLSSVVAHDKFIDAVATNTQFMYSHSYSTDRHELTVHNDFLEISIDI